MGFLLQAGALIVIIFRPKVPPIAKIDPLAMAVPLVFHLYFNWIGFQNGYYFEITDSGICRNVHAFPGTFYSSISILEGKTYPTIINHLNHHPYANDVKSDVPPGQR